MSQVNLSQELRKYKQATLLEGVTRSETKAAGSSSRVGALVYSSRLACTETGNAFSGVILQENTTAILNTTQDTRQHACAQSLFGSYK